MTGNTPGPAALLEVGQELAPQRLVLAVIDIQPEDSPASGCGGFTVGGEASLLAQRRFQESDYPALCSGCRCRSERCR